MLGSTESDNSVPRLRTLKSLDEINKREQAVFEAWEKTPLTTQRALFVTEEPKIARTTNQMEGI